MTDRYQELQDKLATVAFLTELLSLEDPFKKGVHGEGEARARVVASFKTFAQNLKDTLLDEQKPPADPDDGIVGDKFDPPAVAGFSPQEVLVLKAWAKKISSKPEIQKILGGAVQTTIKPRGRIKVLPPQTGAKVDRVGQYGKIIDIEDAQGTVGGNIDSGDRFAVLANHPLAGYLTCAVVDHAGNPTGVQFIVHNSLPEWETK